MKGTDKSLHLRPPSRSQSDRFGGESDWLDDLVPKASEGRERWPRHDCTERETDRRDDSLEELLRRLDERSRDKESRLRDRSRNGPWRPLTRLSSQSGYPGFSISASPGASVSIYEWDGHGRPRRLSRSNSMNWGPAATDHQASRVWDYYQGMMPFGGSLLM